MTAKQQWMLQPNHQKNNIDCEECIMEHPLPCRCKGLVHADAAKSATSAHRLKRQCDQCLRFEEINVASSGTC